MTVDKKRVILIVDDEADFLRSTSSRLKFEGYETVEAADGEEALMAMERVKPDLILLDIMMPKMTGVQLYEQLKKSPSTKDIPIIFLSVWDQLVPSGAKELNHSSKYVPKPFDFQTLLAAIKTLVE